MKLKAHHPNSGTIVCPQSSLVLGGFRLKRVGVAQRERNSVFLYHSDPHFLRVPCWKVTLFVIVPVLGPLVALIICYNWLHRRLAGAVSGQHRTTVQQGTQADQNGEKWNQGPTFQGWDCLPPVSPCSHQNSQKKLRINEMHGSLSGKGGSSSEDVRCVGGNLPLITHLLNSLCLQDSFSKS